MEEWDDIENAIAQIRIEESLGGVFVKRGGDRFISKEVGGRKDGGKQGDNAFTPNKTPIELGQPKEDVEVDGWNSSGNRNYPPHPATPINNSIEIGVSGSQELLVDDDQLPQEVLDIPQGIKSGQVLIWNHSSTRWEADELVLNIVDNKIQIKSLGSGLLLTEAGVEECE